MRFTHNRDPLRYLDVDMPLPSECPEPKSRRHKPRPFLALGVALVLISIMIAIVRYDGGVGVFKRRSANKYPAGVPSLAPVVETTTSTSWPATPAPSIQMTKRPHPPNDDSGEPEPESSTMPLELVGCIGGNCGECQGDCDGDEDCRDDLLCFQRVFSEPIPGCNGDADDLMSRDFCFSYRGELPILQLNGDCHADLPCGMCQGDCDDDTQCEPGLVCWQRGALEPVPGCGGFGVHSKDYCTDPALKGVSYIPGDLTVKENGLLLSTGLMSRIVATTGEPVQYYDGGESSISFHENPDAAGIFETEDGGWIYASNSESQTGGVGAIQFDNLGRVIKYEMVARHSEYNCGGGKTWWDTWISCEEVKGGQVWEVDPHGVREDRMTLMGGNEGGMFESAAYYRPNATNPTFYVTEDSADGALRRFTPDEMAVQVANQNNDFSELLHSNATGTAKIEFLKLIPVNDDWGTYLWTTDKAAAQADAIAYYSNAEGIDQARGILYVTAKEPKILLSLDLEHGTYERSSTKSGAFDEKPDQIKFILGDNAQDDILYFCEDGAEKPNSGIHGRDASGKFYSVIDGPDYESEVTGLAFSPDHKHMYVSYQKSPGIIFDIERRDGYPFGGARLDIKYHEMTS